MEIGFIVVVALAVAILTLIRISVDRDRRYAIDQWRKWELEYYRLKRSDACDTANYRVELSWQKYSDDCVCKVTSDEQ